MFLAPMSNHNVAGMYRPKPDTCKPDTHLPLTPTESAIAVSYQVDAVSLRADKAFHARSIATTCERGLLHLDAAEWTANLQGLFGRRPIQSDRDEIAFHRLEVAYIRQPKSDVVALIDSLGLHGDRFPGVVHVTADQAIQFVINRHQVALTSRTRQSLSLSRNLRHCYH